MNKETVFNVWAPIEGKWSPWVKPVLFAHLEMPWTPGILPPTTSTPLELPVSGPHTALIINLPGVRSALLAPSLARSGYQPIPLFNAAPPNAASVRDVPLSQIEASMAANVYPIMSALYHGTVQLLPFASAPERSPAFLLDSQRMGSGPEPSEGIFDNRSKCFVTDFPSASFLLREGISRVLLIQQDTIAVPEDLSHVLSEWQKAGLTLDVMQENPRTEPSPLNIQERPRFHRMFQRALASLGLRHAIGGAGGFGAWVGDSSAG